MFDFSKKASHVKHIKHSAKCLMRHTAPLIILSEQIKKLQNQA